MVLSFIQDKVDECLASIVWSKYPLDGLESGGGVKVHSWIEVGRRLRGLALGELPHYFIHVRHIIKLII